MHCILRFLYGGKFYLSNEALARLCYKRKNVYGLKNVDPDKLSRIELEEFIKDGVAEIGKVCEFWYSISGKTLHEGIKEIVVDRDIVELCETISTNNNTLDVYVVQEYEVSPKDIVDFADGRKPRPSQSHRGSPSTQGPTSSTFLNLCSQTPTLTPDSNPKSVQPKSLPNNTLRNSLPKNTLKKPVQLQTPRSIPSTSVHTVEEARLEEESATSEDEDAGLVGSESSCDDSDYVLYQEDIFRDDSFDDDGDFEDNVDATVFDENISKDDGDENGEDVFDVRVESDDYRSFSGSDDDIHYRYPSFNAIVDFRNKISLNSGLIFASNEIFRKALRQYAIENGFDYYYLHNDKSKVSAYCKNKCQCALTKGRKKCVCKVRECDFKAVARKMGSDGSFQLKTFHPEHTCGWQDRNSKMTSTWLAEKYLEHYRDDPQWRIKAFMQTVRREHSVDITYHQAWRARVRAILMTQGFAPEQYAKVWDYASTILKYNQGSSVFVRPSQTIERPLKFERFYVCFKACKDGFLNGCRPLIGIDGSHLKGCYTGQVFSAVAKDGNENIFPVAFVVVEQENKDTWCWFIHHLMNDIEGKPLTFMSDRCKGLLEALAEVAPMCDTRVCVRHMHNNFKKFWPGQAFKDAVWTAAKATTLPEFENAMGVIRDMNHDAAAYLMLQDPRTWSLHGFRYFPKSDMQLNNACEQFNNCILEAREMSILSMCEWIRRKLMKMFIKKRNKMRAHQGLITPEIQKKINDIRAESIGRCQCHGDGDLYEVDSGGRTFVVNLVQRSCGCNMWDITGIPCHHAIACILRRRLRVEDFVDPFYHTSTYMRAYGLSIVPMPGEDQWEKTDQPPLDPPKLVVQPGRPKKSRKKEPGEDKEKAQLKRARLGKNRCSNYGQEGHIRTCKNPPKPPEPAREPNRGGRPPKEKNYAVQPQKRKYTKRKVRAFEAEPSNVASNVNQFGMEQDNDVQAMIEQAMMTEEHMAQPDEVDIVVTTQASQSMAPPSSHQAPSQPDAIASAQSSMQQMNQIKKKTTSTSINSSSVATRSRQGPVTRKTSSSTSTSYGEK